MSKSQEHKEQVLPLYETSVPDKELSKLYKSQKCLNRIRRTALVIGVLLLLTVLATVTSTCVGSFHNGHGRDTDAGYQYSVDPEGKTVTDGSGDCDDAMESAENNKVMDDMMDTMMGN